MIPEITKHAKIKQVWCAGGAILYVDDDVFFDIKCPATCCRRVQKTANVQEFALLWIRELHEALKGSLGRKLL